VVIGTGGLGHVAVQILRVLTPATVIAVDVNDEKLHLARDVNATMGSCPAPTRSTRLRTSPAARVPRPCSTSSSQPTIDFGQAVIRVEGDLVLVGVGAGTTKAGLLASPFDSAVRAP
jgi:propanol-preferring alcohol dehydrogenase